MPQNGRTNKHVHGETALWLKGVEAQMAKARKLTVVIRQGDRSDRVAAPERWLPLLTPVPTYYIAVPGDQAKGIAAQFEPDDGTTVQIVRRAVTRLGDIVDADLRYAGGVANGSAVSKIAKNVKQYLEGELAPGKTFSPDDLITIYHVQYLPKQQPAV